MLASEWLMWQALVLVAISAVCWVRPWIRPVPDNWDRWLLVGGILTLLAMGSYFLGVFLEPSHAAA